MSEEEDMDRFARGELSPAESRELARKALDSPELFEELTSTAIAKTELAKRTRRRITRQIYALLATAAALVLAISMYALRSPPVPVTVRAPVPTMAMAGPLVFLPHTSDTGSVFRGETTDSRAPRARGAVISAPGGTVTIDLGSLDGLAKGDEVEVAREGKTIGVVKLTAIFRERARAEAPADITLHPRDEIRVPPAAYLRAALDQIAASIARGDSEGARRMAGQAALAETPDIEVSGYEDLNNLAGIAALHGDKVKAIALYSRALDAGPPPTARDAIMRNLASVQGSH